MGPVDWRGKERAGAVLASIFKEMFLDGKAVKENGQEDPGREGEKKESEKRETQLLNADSFL